jgi:membrane protein implicated in regulation of membrane protease activity
VIWTGPLITVLCMIAVSLFVAAIGHWYITILFVPFLPAVVACYLLVAAFLTRPVGRNPRGEVTQACKNRSEPPKDRHNT